METLEKWEGTPAALLGKLEGQIGPGDTPKGWPTTAAALGKRLRNASRALEAIGIDLHVGRSQKGRTYTLTRIHPDTRGT